jgi:hypothetical protein
MTDGLDFHRFNQQIVAGFRETGGVGELGPADEGDGSFLLTRPFAAVIPMVRIRPV